jgi:hypothetical protein
MMDGFGQLLAAISSSGMQRINVREQMDIPFSNEWVFINVVCT